MDTSFLSGGPAQGVTAPNPLALAGQGLTLADLMNKVQTGQIGLETTRSLAAAYQDPDVLRALGQAIGGGQPGGGEFDLSALSKYGLATPQLVKSLQEMGIQSATIAKDRAQALEANIKAQTQQIGTLSDYANNAAKDPSPQNITGVFRQLQHANIPLDFFGSVPALGSVPEVWRKYFGGIAAASATPEAQATIAKTLTMLPLEAAASQAGTQEALTKTGLMPYEASTARLGAQAAASQAATHAADVFTPRVDMTPQGPVAVNRFALGGPGAPPQQTVSPIGASVRAAPIPVATQDQITDLSKKAQSAAQLQQMLMEMRANDAKGIYSGGVMGSDGAKKMVNILGGLGLLTPEQYQKLSTTQVFDSDSQQVIADAVSQFAGSRIAARELPFFAGTKPSTLQTQQAREQLYGTLYNRSGRVIDQADQAGKYLTAPGANGAFPTDLSGFQPKFQERPLPPIQMDKKPDPALHFGAVWVDNDGTKYKSNGTQWMLVK